MPEVLTLLVIGLLSGIVTGLSPCILPVLPAVLATSAIPAGLVDPATQEPPKPDRRRPFMVIAALVASFALFTLIGGTLLSALGLPADLLRNIGIAAMLLVGIGLLFPAFGHLLERPFARFGSVGPRRSGSAFLFGATFGLVFVPCAGPVLATITVLAATNQVQAGLVLLTIAFSIGVAIPLLGFALAGEQMVERIKAVRTRMPLVRQITGAVLIVTARWQATHDRRSARQGCARRFLDLLMHQLPTHPAVPDGLGCEVPRHGPDHRWRALT